MKKLFFSLLFLCVCSISVFSQDKISRAGASVSVNPDGSVTVIDAAGKTFKLTPQSGAPPTSCVDGQFYARTNVGVFYCTNTTWALLGSGGSGATIPSVTNLISGDGAGNGADSGIAPANVVQSTRLVNGHPLSSNVTVTPSDLSLVVGTNVEAHDTDLTVIAGLSPSNDDLLQRKSGAWINRTLAQIKSDLALDNVNNTSDASKPVSTAQQTAIDLKANLASPALTGSPTAPTQSQSDNSTKVATTAYVDTLGATKQNTITLLGLNLGGTHVDLSATGGPNQVAMQETVGGNFTVRVLGNSDIPSTLSSKSITTPTRLDDPLASSLPGTCTAGENYSRSSDNSKWNCGPANTWNQVWTANINSITDNYLSLAVKPAVTVVATSNQTLSGTPTLDGVSTADGSVILATAQSTGSQNGPWVAHSGAWTRPTWYAAANTTQAFQFITTFVRLGTLYQGTTWRQTAAAPITVDTTATTWVETPLALNSTSVGGTLPAAVFPALTGAITTSAGSLATAPGKVDVMQTSFYCSDAGANDTYACNLSPAATAYVTGTHYRFKANTANTGAATINFNSVGALTIKKAAGGITTDLADNDIRAGQWVDCVYDGTNCQMQSTLGNAGGGGITNGAGSNVVTKSDGTNLVASTLTDTGTSLTGTIPWILTPGARSSGVASFFTINAPADTNQTASTESIGVNIVGSTRQWATGTLALQRMISVSAPTYGFVGASTLTQAVTMDLAIPVVGTNATFTGASALRISSAPFASSKMGLVSLGSGQWDGATSGFFTGVAAGTLIAGNLPSGSTADLINLQLNGVDRFKVAANGNLTVVNGNIVSGGNSLAAATASIGMNGRSAIWSSANGLLELTVSNGSGFTRLNFGNNSPTNSQVGIGFDAVNGLSIKSAAGTDTYNDASTANSGTVTNRCIFCHPAPTLTSTGTSVTYTNAATVRIAGGPTASTNVTITNGYALEVDAGVSLFAGNVLFSTTAQVHNYTVAGLPTCNAGAQGQMAAVTDALAPSFLVTIAGGGSTYSPVICNGTNWIAH